MRRTLLAVLLFPLVAAAQSIEPIELRPFTPDSYNAILDAHAGRPFLLAFWSVDCPPCYRELEMLGRAGAGRAFATVLVSTDGPDADERVREALGRFGLEHAEAWLFDGPPLPRRFAVDRTWYGELPRSYLFDAAHRRTAVTGVVGEEHLKELFLGSTD